MSNKEWLDKLENKEGYFKNNNYHVVNLSDDNITLRADLTENSMNPYGIAHGGLIFGLGDTVMGMLAKKDGRDAVTLSANITYLKPGIGEYITAKGEVIKNGKQTCFLRANIYNDQKKLIATMESNYCYID